MKIYRPGGLIHPFDKDYYTTWPLFSLPFFQRKVVFLCQNSAGPTQQSGTKRNLSGGLSSPGTAIGRNSPPLSPAAPASGKPTRKPMPGLTAPRRSNGCGCVMPTNVTAKRKSASGRLPTTKTSRPKERPGSSPTSVQNTSTP